MSKIVHFEIPVDDAERATSFYRAVLNWEISRYGDEDYWLASCGGDDEPGANGALTRRSEIHRAPVVVAGVDNIDDALKRAEQAGGQVAMGKQPIEGMGWSAYVRDTEGNLISFFQMDAAAAPAQ